MADDRGFREMGFPPEMIDDEPEEVGYEVVIKGRQDY